MEPLIKTQERRRVVVEKTMLVTRQALVELLGNKAPPQDARIEVIGAGDSFSVLFVWEVSQDAVDLIAVKKPSRRKNLKGPSPASQTRAGRIVLQALSTGDCTYKELALTLKEMGYAGSTTSATTGGLIREGAIEKFGPVHAPSFRMIRK